MGVKGPGIRLTAQERAEWVSGHEARMEIWRRLESEMIAEHKRAIEEADAREALQEPRIQEMVEHLKSIDPDILDKALARLGYYQ